MANTYKIISSTTLSTSAASVTFSSIPSTYTDLIIKMSVRNPGGGQTNYGFGLELNGSSAANYSNTNLYTTNGTSIASNRFTTTTAFSYWYFRDTVSGSASTANTFSNAEIYIPNYNSSDKKVAFATGAGENAAVTAGLNAASSLWQLTNPITQIKFDSNSDNFAAGSSFFLYGIKNG